MSFPPHQSRPSGYRRNSVLQWGAEPSLVGQWLPAAVGDGAWSVRTGSGLMLMCCDIFAAAQLWMDCLLTAGHLSSWLLVVVGAGDVLWGSLLLTSRKNFRQVFFGEFSRKTRPRGIFDRCFSTQLHYPTLTLALTCGEN